MAKLYDNISTITQRMLLLKTGKYLRVQTFEIVDFMFIQKCVSMKGTLLFLLSYASLTTQAL